MCSTNRIEVLEKKTIDVIEKKITSCISIDIWSEINTDNDRAIYSKQYP